MSRIENPVVHRNDDIRIVLLTGPAAAGKSTIAEMVPEGYQVREIGDELLVALQERGISIATKAEIQHLPAMIVKTALEELLQTIVETATTDQVIVGHLGVPQEGTYVSHRKFYETVVRPDAVLAVMAYPGDLSMRQQSSNRQRVQQPPRVNGRLQLRILGEALALGEEIGAHFVPIMSRGPQNGLTRIVVEGTFNMLNRR